MDELVPFVFEPEQDCEEMNLHLESEARTLWCAFSHVVQGEKAAVGLSVSPMPSFNRVGYAEGKNIGVPLATHCLASGCAHWRWRQPGGTKYEKRSFSSDFPVPNGIGSPAPADVEKGWTFLHWDANAKGAPTPRYWAKRAVEIVLPRGLCGLAGEP